MKKSTQIICGCATLIFLTAAAVWLFCFSKINNNCTTMEINIGLLIAAPLFVYLLLSYIVHKGLPVPLFIIVLILTTGGGAFLFTKSVKLEPFSLSTVIVICVIYCLSFVVSAFIAYDPVKESGVAARFDISVFLLIILLIINKWLDFPAYKAAVIACLVAIAASLAALISIRAGRYSSGREQIQGDRRVVTMIIAAIAALLAVFAAAIYYFAAGGLEHTAGVLAGIISWLAGVIKTVAAFLWSCINHFFTWLASLFQPTEFENADVSIDSIQMSATESEQLSVQVPAWFYVILGVILLLVIILIIIKVRKKRFRKAILPGKNVDDTIVRTNHFKTALLELLRNIKAKIIFKINCQRYKNSIPGLIILCSKAAPSDLAWKKSESAAGFIRRFADYLNKEDISSDALYLLAELSEKQFYSKESINMPSDLYAKVKAVLKQSI